MTPKQAGRAAFEITTILVFIAGISACVRSIAT